MKKVTLAIRATDFMAKTNLTRSFSQIKIEVLNVFDVKLLEL